MRLLGWLWALPVTLLGLLLVLKGIAAWQLLNDYCPSQAFTRMTMSTRSRQPADDPSSAPESGTVRDDTSGNQPSDRGDNPAQQKGAGDPGRQGAGKDNPDNANEEG